MVSAGGDEVYDIDNYDNWQLGRQVANGGLMQATVYDRSKHKLNGPRVQVRKVKGGGTVVTNAYEMHQRELWIRICQIVNGDPDVKEWTPEALSDKLGIPVGSPGFQRILEVLAQKDLEQAQERQRIQIGFR